MNVRDELNLDGCLFNSEMNAEKIETNDFLFVT